MWYFILAALWVFTCLAIGLYIRGKIRIAGNYYVVGLKAILISYAFGISALFAIITHFQ
ncbi:MAG: hypothetical protein ACXVPN_11275 [Bacteroidia bacterium]